MFESLGMGIDINMTENVSSVASRITNALGGIQTSATNTIQNLQGLGIAGQSLSRAGASIQNSGNKILNVFKNLGKSVISTGGEFELYEAQMLTAFGSIEEAQKKMKWSEEFAVKTPFDVSGTIRAVSMMKSQGLDVTKEFKSIKGEAKSFLEYMGDLSTKNMGQGGGFEGMAFAVSNLMGGDGGKSLRSRFDLSKKDIEPLIASSQSGNMEQFAEDFTKLADRVMPDAMRNIQGTWTQILSELSESWEIFQSKVAKAGFFDKIKGTLTVLGEAFRGITADKNIKTFSDILSNLWKPIDKAVRYGAKLVEWVFNFASANPKIATMIGTFTALSGVAFVLSGVFLQLAGTSISALSGLASMVMIFSMSGLGGGIATSTKALMSFISVLGLIGGVAGVSFLAYKKNIMGAKDMFDGFANSVKESKIFKDLKLLNEAFKVIFSKDKSAELGKELTKQLDSAGMLNFVVDLQAGKRKADEIIDNIILKYKLLDTAMKQINKGDMDALYSDKSIEALTKAGLWEFVEQVAIIKPKVDALVKGMIMGFSDFAYMVGKALWTVTKVVGQFIMGALEPLEGKSKVFSALGDALRDLNQADVDQFAKIGYVIGNLVGYSLALGGLVIALKGLKLAVVGIAGIVSGFASLTGVLKLIPVVFIAGIFSTIIRGGERSDKILGSLGRAFSRLGDVIFPVYKITSDFLDMVGKDIEKEGISEGLKTAFSRAFKDLESWWEADGEEIIRDLAKSVGEVFGHTLGGMLAPSPDIDVSKSNISNTNLWETIGRTIGEAFAEGFKEAFNLNVEKEGGLFKRIIVKLAEILGMTAEPKKETSKDKPKKKTYDTSTHLGHTAMLEDHEKNLKENKKESIATRWQKFVSPKEPKPKTESRKFVESLATDKGGKGKAFTGVTTAGAYSLGKLATGKRFGGIKAGAVAYGLNQNRYLNDGKLDNRDAIALGTNAYVGYKGYKTAKALAPVGRKAVNLAKMAGGTLPIATGLGAVGTGAGIAKGAYDLSTGIKNNDRAKKYQGGAGLGMTGTGAMIGAGIGSVIPVLGTLAGGLIGGGIGGLASLFKSEAVGNKTMNLVDKAKENRANKVNNASLDPNDYGVQSASIFPVPNIQGIKDAGEEVKSVWRGVNESTNTSWESNSATVEAKSGGIQSSISNWFSQSGQNIRTVWNDVSEGISSNWTRFWGYISTKAQDIYTSISNWFSQSGQNIRAVWEGVATATSNAWSRIWGYVTTKASDIYIGVITRFTSIREGIIDTWVRVKTATSEKWEEVKTTVSTKANDLLENVKSLPKKMADGILKGKEVFGKAFKSIWDGAVTMIQKPVNTIIGGANWVLKELGAPELPLWKYAEGTGAGGHKGGHALVNDESGSTFQEAVIFPNGKTIIPEGRNVMIPNMPVGTQVLKASDTAKLFKYEKGTDGAKDIVSGWIDKGKEVVNNTIDIFSMMSNPKELASSVISKFVKFDGASGIGLDIGKGIVGKAKDYLGDFLRSKFHMGGSYGGMSGFSGLRMTSPYGMRKHPISGKTKMHTGVDFGGGQGTGHPIHAQANGVVNFAGSMGGYGNTVRTQAGAYEHMYAHLSRIVAGMGQTVTKGQLVGLMGSTGNSTGPHVHYEVRKNGKHINPMSADGGGANFGVGNPVGAGVERWRGTVEQALRMNGLPTSPAYVNAWLRQIKTESGGNPNAVQGVKDVNSRSGDLAKGLVQVIGATFNRYAFPGHTNRMNGLDSLLAGINYAKSRYGAEGMLNRIGKGRGYAKGTNNAMSGWHWVGEEGAELVNFGGGEQVKTNRESSDIVSKSNLWSKLSNVITGNSESSTQLKEVTQSGSRDVNIDKVEVIVQADRLSRGDARNQALMILEEIEKLRVEEHIRTHQDLA